MQNQARLSAASRDPTYVYSAPFKLQRAVVANVAKLAVLLDVRGLELEQAVCSMLLPLLHAGQPAQLQLLSVQALGQCALIDPDVVWLALNYVLPVKVPQHPLQHIGKCEQQQLTEPTRSQLEQLIESV